MSDPYLQTAELAAQAGAEVVRRWFRDAALTVESKAAHDFVTAADRESERAIVETILSRHPDHAILAEESGGRRGSGGVEWLIDPLDGTSNFMHGLPVFCVSVACRRGAELLAGVIVDPLRDEVFTAARGEGAWWNGKPMSVSDKPSLDGAFLATGYPFKARRALDAYLTIFRDVFHRAKAIRRCGAAALDLAYTAAGVYDGFFEFRLAPWDLAAGILMIQEAGGRATDLDGGEGYIETGSVVAGGPGVQPDLLATVRRTADERKLSELEPAEVPVVAAREREMYATTAESDSER